MAVILPAISDQTLFVGCHCKEASMPFRNGFFPIRGKPRPGVCTYGSDGMKRKRGGMTAREKTQGRACAKEG